MELSADEIQRAVRAALAEDIGPGDVTTLATVPESATMCAEMVAREPLVLAGLAFAMAAFRELDRTLVIAPHARDGDSCDRGETLLRVNGPARAILAAERVALNFVQRLSGVATLTAQFVEQVKGTQAKILDTRKTTPGWRRFEKYAVHCGGGTNHRVGLFDLVLIKDNHLAALRHEQPNAIAAAVQRARAAYPELKVEVEADTLEQVRQAVEARADIILLDNMSLPDLRAALAGGRAIGGAALGAVRAGTSMGSAASTAYKLGQESTGSTSVGAGLKGVASAAGGALRNRAAGAFGIGEAAASGRQAAFDALAHRQAPAASGSDQAAEHQPAWAQALRRQQDARHHRQVVAHTLREDGAWIVGKLLESEDYNWGFNAATGEYQDLVKAGVTSIIWATGFATDYSWLKVDAFDDNGKPQHQRGVSSEPGVYFLGLPWQSRRGSSFIWGVWHDAKYVADHIAIQRSYLDYHDAAQREAEVVSLAPKKTVSA